jgi:hypothetical protein
MTLKSLSCRNHLVHCAVGISGEGFRVKVQKLCSSEIKKHLMTHIIVTFIHIELMTSNNCKSCFKIEIDCSGIANPGVKPHPGLAIAF